LFVQKVIVELSCILLHYFNYSILVNSLNLLIIFEFAFPSGPSLFPHFSNTFYKTYLFLCYHLRILNHYPNSFRSFIIKFISMPLHFVSLLQELSWLHSFSHNFYHFYALDFLKKNTISFLINLDVLCFLSLPFWMIFNWSF
jgi:hypothetical protein